MDVPKKRKRRSQDWFGRQGKDGFLHRSWIKNQGYPDDLFDGDFPEFTGREQDLFTWFSLLAKCCRCSQLLAVTDFECA